MPEQSGAGSEAMPSLASLPQPMQYSLPQDLIEAGARRVSLAALGLVAVLAVIFATYQIAVRLGWTEFARAMFSGPATQVGVGILVVLSLGMAIVARSGRVAPQTVLDVSLVYAVVCAFGISMLESMLHWPAAAYAHGISWVCLWILVFAVMVPSVPAKSAVTAFACAAMGPLAYAVSIAMGKPTMHFSMLASLFLPHLAAALLAVAFSRALYSLGTAVSQARHMGSYQLAERLGRGGMGEVWRAEHRRLPRSAAVKLIRADALGTASRVESSTAVRRFELEAAATSLLRSPHTVELYDFGRADDGTIYYVMELLSGLDGEELVRRFGLLPPERVANLLRQVCLSLAEAHQVGLIHRDIKPGNLFVCRLGTELDFVKVLDFGLVRPHFRSRDADHRLTQEGVNVGTPAYLAPELILADEGVDGRADLYALGCVAYWLLTGTLVFDGDTAMKIAMRHVRDLPAPPSGRVEVDVPPDLEAIVMQCLEKDPRDRPDDALELERLLAGCSFVEPWSPERAETWWRKHLPDIAGSSSTESLFRVRAS